MSAIRDGRSCHEQRTISSSVRMRSAIQKSSRMAESWSMSVQNDGTFWWIHSAKVDASTGIVGMNV